MALGIDRADRDAPLIEFRLLKIQLGDIVGGRAFAILAGDRVDAIDLGAKNSRNPEL